MARGYFVGVTNGLCEHSRARRILRFFASTSRNKKFALRACKQLQKFGEHERASTRFNFASKSSKGKILRAVKNFNGPFITPFCYLQIFLCSLKLNCPQN